MYVCRVDDSEESGGATGASTGAAGQSDDDRVGCEGEVFCAVATDTAAAGPCLLSYTVHLHTCLLTSLLAVKAGYGRTVSNIQGKGIPNEGSSYRKTARPETCADQRWTRVGSTRGSGRVRSGQNF